MAKLPTLKKKDATPAKRVTGTSYTSNPAIAPPSEIYNEVGSQRGSSIPEVVPELGSRGLRIRTYDKMVKGDVSVRISLRANKAPVFGGDYYFEPFDDSPGALALAEFASKNIFHCPSSPWLLQIQDVCRMIENGNSIENPIYELREWAPTLRKSTGTQGGNTGGSTGVPNRKVYTMIKKIAYRPASSIIKINYDDNGGPESVDHNAIRADGKVEQVNIPIDQLLIFVFEGDGTDMEGLSVLRNAYEHWFYKHNLYKIDAIQKERHGIGVPDIELPVGFSSKDKTIAHQLGRNLRTNEFAYIVRPPNFQVGFAELKGQLVDALASASHHDLEIMKNVLIQFLQPNSSDRASSATAADIFLKTTRYLGSYICEVYNKFLVPKLIAYNFETDQFPEMKVRNIGEVKDLQMWSAAVSNLAKQGVLEIDDDTENFARDVLQFPRRTSPRANKTAQAAAAKKPGSGNNETTGNINNGTPSGA